jgi:hypothetical protein
LGKGKDLHQRLHEHAAGSPQRPAQRGSRDRQRSDASSKATSGDKDAPSAQGRAPPALAKMLVTE